MKIELTTVITYDLKVGAKAFKGLRAISEWEGFTKYANDKSWFIGVETGTVKDGEKIGSQTVFTVMFNGLVPTSGDIKRAQILNASGDIIDALNDYLDSGVEKEEP